MKTNVQKVHLAIAKVGHDTNMHKAKDEVYNELHGCCKYEREKSKKKKLKSSGCSGSKDALKKGSCCGKS